MWEDIELNSFHRVRIIQQHNWRWFSRYILHFYYRHKVWDSWYSRVRFDRLSWCCSIFCIEFLLDIDRMGKWQCWQVRIAYCPRSVVILNCMLCRKTLASCIICMMKHIFGRFPKSLWTHLDKLVSVLYWLCMFQNSISIQLSKKGICFFRSM